MTSDPLATRRPDVTDEGVAKPTLTAEEKLARVRKMLLEEIRRLTGNDMDTSGGGRRFRHGVEAARSVSAQRLTWIVEATTDE